jgi:hypothetical protein
MSLFICVNLAGKVERRKKAGKGQVEIVLTRRAILLEIEQSEPEISLLSKALLHAGFTAN